MRTIKRIYKAEYRPIANLITYSPLPSRNLEMVDPFIFLNHHGPQNYGPDNSGLPFGPHPHRGMETVTIIIDGDIAHKDSGGNDSVIESGGVQWMTAGKGLIHSEVSSESFKRKGGRLEILQLWVNLPSRLKMTAPKYKGLQKDEIPVTVLDEGKVKAQVISGRINDSVGAFESMTGITLSTMFLEKKGVLKLKVPKEHNILCYIIKGEVKIHGDVIEKLHLIEFNDDDEQVYIEAREKSIILFGHAAPFNEPVVFGGPFVMNTEEEIQQAYEDYKAGKFELN